MSENLRADGQGLRVLYVLKRYPRLSETFVVREILALEAAGATISIDGLLPSEAGIRHPEVDLVNAEARTLPHHPSMRQPATMAVHLPLAARHPLRWGRAATRAARAGQWRRFLQAGWVAQRIQRERVDHVHAHFATAAAEVAGHAAALAGVGWTVTAHAKDIFQSDNVSLLPRRVRTARAVVTISDHNRDYLEACLQGAPVRLVRNAVESAEPDGPAARGPVLCVSRLVEKKGIDVLLDAVAIAALSIPALQVEVVGDGVCAEKLRAQAQRLGIADRVRFLGPMPSAMVAAAYRRCSMVVVPCRIAADGDRDGLPTVFLEALARGVPVISTAVAGIDELIRDGETGLLVSPEDSAALAGAIEKLWLEPDLGRRMGLVGREVVRTLHDPETNARLLLNVFREVIA